MDSTSSFLRVFASFSTWQGMHAGGHRGHGTGGRTSMAAAVHEGHRVRGWGCCGARTRTRSTCACVSRCRIRIEKRRSQVVKINLCDKGHVTGSPFCTSPTSFFGQIVLAGFWWNTDPSPQGTQEWFHHGSRHFCLFPGVDPSLYTANLFVGSHDFKQKAPDTHI